MAGRIPSNRVSSQYRQGLIIMTCGVLSLPVMDAIGKYLSTEEGMSPGQVTFYRFLFQVIATVPVIVLLRGHRGLQPHRWGPNLLRGILLGGASLCVFTALKYMPLADTLAIFFVEPFILTVLSALVLRERVRRPQWLAIFVGFAGAVIVINPSFSLFGVVALLPLASASLFAGYMLLNRALGTHDAPLVMQYVAGIGGSALLGLVLLGGSVTGVANFIPSLPTSAINWGLVLIIGIIAAYAHLLVVWAFQKAPASILAPFQYLEIISAALLGYIMFGEFPSLSKLLGIAIIIASGLFIFRQEQ